jgi:branched-chain amino acid transport system permease protein
VGLDTWRYRFAAFMLSAAIAGLAGALYFLVTGPSLTSGSIVPTSLNWPVSGNLVVMVVLGGLGTIAGPLIGVFVFRWFGTVLNGAGYLIPGLEFIGPIGQYWQLLLALMFTTVVWAYPEGFWGMITDFTGALRESRALPAKAVGKIPGVGSEEDSRGGDRE